MTDQTPAPPALDLAALTVIANAATPGPWDHHSFGSAGDDEPRAIIVHAGDFDWQAINAGDYVVATPRWDADEDMNARHIAAFDPPTVLALIARAEAAEAKIAAVREANEELSEESEWALDMPNNGSINSVARATRGSALQEATRRIDRALDGTA